MRVDLTACNATTVTAALLQMARRARPVSVSLCSSSSLSTKLRNRWYSHKASAVITIGNAAMVTHAGMGNANRLASSLK